jgi:hypothetical protein
LAQAGGQVESKRPWTSSSGSVIRSKYVPRADLAPEPRGPRLPGQSVLRLDEVDQRVAGAVVTDEVVEVLVLARAH